MRMRSRGSIALGMALIGLAIVWYFGLGPRWTQRIPPGWRWESNFIGIATYPDPATGKFPERDSAGPYERLIQGAPGDTGAPMVTLEDYYIIRDPNTDQKVYEYVYRAPVVRTSGAHADLRYRDEQFVFPREVERRTYTLRYSYLKGIPVAFQGEEEIEGVTTYLFSYKGRGEYTESYAGTAEYPGIAVAPGQEIRCADDQFVFKIWVEPITGATLKVDESCYSGDYIYDIATGRQIAPVLRWGGVTTGDDVIRRAEFISAERRAYLWASRYLPAILLASGLIALLPGLPGRRAQGN